MLSGIVLFPMTNHLVVYKHQRLNKDALGSVLNHRPLMFMAIGHLFASAVIPHIALAMEPHLTRQGALECLLCFVGRWDYDVVMWHCQDNN